jgi:hypothetical protein
MGCAMWLKYSGMSTNHQKQLVAQYKAWSDWGIDAQLKHYRNLMSMDI